MLRKTSRTAVFKGVYISMTASDNSVINKTMKHIFAIKKLKQFILKLHPKGAINIGKNIIYGLTIFS